MTFDRGRSILSSVDERRPTKGRKRRRKAKPTHRDGDEFAVRQAVSRWKVPWNQPVRNPTEGRPTLGRAHRSAEGAGPEECGRLRPNRLLGASPRPDDIFKKGGALRIVSLLPSATEIVYALGLEDDLVGVTAECDAPAAARFKPTVSWPVIAPADDGTRRPPGEVDDAVSAAMAAGEQLYRLDEELIRSLAPDLILAQDLCRVCAVPSGDVAAALDRLGTDAQVLSLDPSRLDDVIAGVGEVGAVTGVAARAAELQERLRQRVDAVRRATADAPRRAVLALEWSDPPFQGGHWVPDQIDSAGGRAVLAAPGIPSRRLGWPEIAAGGAEVVAFMPCGYDLADAVTEGANVLARPEFDGAAEVWALDGSAYFSRPGPRVVDGVELLAWVLHPDRVAPPPPGRAVRLR